MQSLKATVLKQEDHVLTIRILDLEATCLAGKEIRINGMKATSVRPLPSSEMDAGKTELSNALIYRIAEQDKMDSIAVGSVCEVTWD